MSSNEIVLDVRNVKTYYYTRRGTVKAVDDVSFSLKRGETIGVVGESGCGKSTLGFTLMRLIPRPGRVVGGEVYLEGEEIFGIGEEAFRRIRWKRISMIFQAAMNALNPVIPVGDQVAEAIMLHEKVPQEEAMEMVKELFYSVGLEPTVIERYPHQLSGGMKQRVVIAMAIALRPTVMIADEPTTALDVTIQAQIMELLKVLQRRYGMSMIYITHDLALEAEIAHRVMVMYAGQIMELGDVEQIFYEPIHPYTKGLIAAVPTVSKAKEKKLFSIPGQPPDLVNPPKGCPFAPRCPYAKDICWNVRPKVQKINGTLVACHFADELKDIAPDEFWKGVKE
ncbi:MAG: ABC transporter ATP-binding protein [Candidatus Njordarchaeia archaeon]